MTPLELFTQVSACSTFAVRRDALVRLFARHNPGMEADDLRQEALLTLWGLCCRHAGRFTPAGLLNFWSVCFKNHLILMVRNAVCKKRLGSVSALLSVEAGGLESEAALCVPGSRYHGPALVDDVRRRLGGVDARVFLAHWEPSEALARKAQRRRPVAVTALDVASELRLPVATVRRSLVVVRGVVREVLA